MVARSVDDMVARSGHGMVALKRKRKANANKCTSVNCTGGAPTAQQPIRANTGNRGE